MYRVRRSLEGPQGREVMVNGRPLLNFCSNDYLGLAGDPRIAAAFKRGVDRWGTGAGASHLICGHTAAHEELEEALAEFTGRPRALLFGSGYAANVGVINALLSVGDFVFEDRLNHASLLDGGWISRATFCWFEHRDTADLDAKLAAVRNQPTRKLIVSDGTFSMDGDPCSLDELVALAKQHVAWTMIDDAHGMGVHGANGVGSVDPERYSTADVAVLVGTLGKAFGTAGAFVAGEEALVETLIQRSRNYIFTTAMPSALAVATLESLAVAQAESGRREHLAALIARFRSGTRELGLKLMPSTSPIQPVVVGDPARALALSRALEQRGFLIGAIRPPTVPEGTSRLRVTLTAAHLACDVDRLIESLNELSACAAPDKAPGRSVPIPN
ncbi:MAG: 8-amino-7-oxononanoate synthase [Gammaproteobacteria bacterium]|nr:8-amino-7-oxononanoate synthase [Gammaproteobacteria bacterium]MDE0441687.1 8-amino-7-oxononanoate synthase [Gammaproteobacteria bacterium]